MNCTGCGNQGAIFFKAGFFKNEDGVREFYEYCEKCGDAGPVCVSDVFWDGKPEENLADGPDGRPRVFLSKGQKAQYLRDHGILEAGDAVHGAPFTAIRHDDGSDRKNRWSAEVREARRKAESMGRDVRRQAVLKIIREARQHEEEAKR